MEQPLDAQAVRDQEDFYSAWAWLLGVVALGLVVGVSYTIEPKVAEAAWFKAVALAEVAAISCWFINAFTGDAYRKRTHAITLSYFFVIASLLLLAVPPFVSSKSIGGEPVGLVSGCVIRTDAKELLCREDGKIPEMPATAVGDVSKVAEKKGKQAEKKGEKKAPEDTKTDQPRNQWLINIGGTLTPQDPEQKECQPRTPCQRMFVTGGIAVPLYFVILALIGGAISLSRRVPELQKRSENDYVGTADERKLQPSEVREMLAFQILQFISAPLIAVTAFQMIRPDGMASTAALAFMSGFGSETVLLMIRGVFNGLKPKSVTPASTGTVAGVVTDSGQAVSNVQVEVAGTALKTKTDDEGRYRLLEVPVGDRTIKASDRNRSGSTQVSVQPGQTATCDISLKRTGSVGGSVKDAQNNPVKDALVTVAAAPSSLKATTDKDGKYLIERVPEGTQTVKAEHGVGSGKTSGTGTATVVYDTLATCDIKIT